jgi:hypothetical protein
MQHYLYFHAAFVVDKAALEDTVQQHKQAFKLRSDQLHAPLAQDSSLLLRLSG